MSLEEEMSNPSDEEIIRILHRRLQTAKEQNEKLTQQNKQMREVIELGLAWVHNHKQCSLDNKCGYEAQDLQNLGDILAQQALNEVNNEK